MNSYRIQVPAYIQKALFELEKGGHEAWAVGGCVRDSLLSKEPHDWDLATNAKTGEIESVFEGYKTVKTGIRHGTLTVLIDSHPVEITTFRTGNEKEQNITLEMDLSHRDFTINAMAYHPDRGLVDLHGGIADLDARVVRFVGSALDRIEEDGLRILRALRFASVLDFSIDGDGDKQIRKKAGYLSVVAAERIMSEFRKCLLGKASGRVVSSYGEVFRVFLPQAAVSLESDKVGLALSYSAPQDPVRLAIAFMPSDKVLPYTEHSAGHYLKMLKADNRTQENVKHILSFPPELLIPDRHTVHKLIVDHGIGEVRMALEYHLALRRTLSGQDEEAQTKVCAWYRDVSAVIDEIEKSGLVLSLRDLAVNGSELISLGICEKGPKVGTLMQKLLDAVICEKIQNQKEQLIEYARSAANS